MTASFIIDRTFERGKDQLDVHVRYDGGMRVFTFPKSYPNSTILAQIRIEFRKQELEGGDRRGDLIGRHDV